MSSATRPRGLLVAALALTTLVVGACSTAGRPAPVTDRDAADREADRTTRVVVRNESEWTLRVYALVGGSQHYLGSLQGFSREVFELPEGASRSTADFRLAARATGPTQDYYSNPVMVERGDTVRWTVRRSFSQTRATIEVS